jgi:hypothetical protein
LIDNSVAATFAFLDVAVFEADFEYSVASAGDLVANEVARLELIK